MHVSYSELLGSGEPWTTADAVALVLAVAEAGESDAAVDADSALQPEDALLSSTGEVCFAGNEPVPVMGTVALARLLRRLLALDERERTRERVPGALVLMIARALGEIDTPPPTRSAFLDTLRRFGGDDRRLLAAIYWRARGHHVAHREPAAAGRGTAAHPAPPLAIAAGSSAERRRSRVTVWDLRRDLRDADRRLFEALRGRSRRIAGLRATAAAVLVVAGIASLVRLTDSGLVLERRPPAQSVKVPSASAVPERRVIGRSGTVAKDLHDSGAQQPPRAPSASRVRAADVVSPAALRGDLFSPSFAPDGELVFHAGRQHAALMRASFDSNGTPRLSTILKDDAANYHPAVSPDGKWLAFDSDRAGTRAVYVSHPDASGATSISGEGYAAVPRWSPDGRWLAFIKADSGHSRVWNVWVAEMATGKLTQVSHHRVGQSWGASWFPDSRRLAFSVEDRLTIVDLQTGRSRVLRSPRPGHLVRTPAVSPDGSQIVFQVYRDGVWMLDMRSGSARRVLADRSAEEFAWSSDGRRIVYHTKERQSWRVAALTVQPSHL